MDARAVLEGVARAYAGLKTISVEILSVAESGDEDCFSRNGQRTKAWFEAPDKVRIEQGGQPGMVLVSDGIDAHSFTAHAGFPNRYSKSDAFPREFLPGVFRPEHATLGGSPPAFLFSRIADKLVSAEILGEDSASILISVIYEQPPDSLWRLSSAVQYSVDSRTYLVSRIEGEVSMRTPAQDETTIHKHILSFVNALVDEPIAQDIFQFVPPPDAADASDPGGCGIAFGGGGGSTFKDAGGRQDTSRALTNTSGRARL